jgi:hypothetical protein
LELLKEIRLSRVGVLWNASNPDNTSALYPLGDSLFATNRKRIVDFAARNRLMLTTRQGAEAGALVA